MMKLKESTRHTYILICHLYSTNNSAFSLEHSFCAYRCMSRAKKSVGTWVSVGDGSLNVAGLFNRPHRLSRSVFYLIVCTYILLSSLNMYDEFFGL